MTPSETRARISNLVADLLELGIAVASYGPIVRRNGNLTMVTWPDRRNSGDAFMSGEFASLADYRDLLQHGNYTCLLSDGAALQLSYLFRHDELIKHRLAYHPCPIVLRAPGLQVGAPADEIFEDQFDDALLDCIDPDNQSALRFRSPIRFDFDLEAAAVHHPASHLHISDENCRCPIYGPVSVGHFARFVFSAFYHDLCERHPQLREWPLDWGNRSIARTEETQMFLECHGAA